jgi:hypothetical protein
MSPITYGQLDEMLRSIGFSVREAVDPRAKVYEHETGALIALPVFPGHKKLLPQHLVGVRVILESYGIIDPTDSAVQPRAT